MNSGLKYEKQNSFFELRVINNITISIITKLLNSFVSVFLSFFFLIFFLTNTQIIRQQIFKYKKKSCSHIQKFAMITAKNKYSSQRRFFSQITITLRLLATLAIN